MNAFRETLRTILTPWCVAAAVLGLAVVTFQLSREDPDSRRGPTGVDVSVWAADGPLRRSIALSWFGETNGDDTPYWSEISERFGVLWLRGGGDRTASTRLQLVRPPGAEVTTAIVSVGLIWWLTAPAIASAACLYFARRRRPPIGEETESADAEPGLAWRLARAWIGTFAPLGVLLVMCGHQADESFWPALGLPPLAASIAPAGAYGQPTRSLSVWQTDTRPIDSFGAPQPKALQTLWGDSRFGLSGEQSTTIWARPDGDRAVRRSGVLLSVWWLVALPAAINLVTLVRRIRGRRSRRPA